MARMTLETLTNKFFAYFLSQETNGFWFIEVEKYVQEEEITYEGIQKCDPLKKKLGAHYSCGVKKERKCTENECGNTGQRLKLKLENS